MFISTFSRSGSNEFAVSITESRNIPFGFSGHRDEKLAPPSDLHIRLKSGSVTALVEYLNLLHERGVTPQGVLAKHTHEAILVCNEDDAHAEILAKWLTDNGVTITQI